MRERPHTQTLMHVNVAFKLSVARFVNSSVILVLVANDDVAGWFGAGGLVEDASILIIIMTFQFSVVYGLDIPGILKKGQKCWQKGKGDACKMT